MFAIALRYAEKFAPSEGTIAAHRVMIEKNGYVWYGKMGTAVSCKNIELIMAQKKPRLLLIHSGGPERYWATIEEISRQQPVYDAFPQYYHDKAEDFKTWFRLVKIEPAPKNIMSLCNVASSGQALSLVSKYSMSPYFIIELDDSVLNQEK